MTSKAQLTEEMRRLMGVAPRPLGPWSDRPEETWKEPITTKLDEAKLKVDWDEGIKIVDQALNKLRTTGPKWLKGLVGDDWKAGKVQKTKGKGAQKKYTGRLRLFVGPSVSNASKTVVVTLTQTEAPGEHDYYTGVYTTGLIEIDASCKLLLGKKGVGGAKVGLPDLSAIQDLTASVLTTFKPYLEKHFGSPSGEDAKDLAKDTLNDAAQELLPWLKGLTGDKWYASSVGPETLRLHVGLSYADAPISMTIILKYDPIKGTFTATARAFSGEGLMDKVTKDNLKSDGLQGVVAIAKSLQPVIKLASEAAQEVAATNTEEIILDAVANLVADGLVWLKDVTGEPDGWKITKPTEHDPWMYFNLNPPGKSFTLTVGVVVDPLDEGEGFQVITDVLGKQGQPFAHHGPVIASEDDLKDLVKVALKPVEKNIKEVIKAEGAKVLTLIKDIRTDYKKMRKGLVMARAALEFVSEKLEVEDFTGVEAKCLEFEEKLGAALDSSKQLRSKLPY